MATLRILQCTGFHRNIHAPTRPSLLDQEQELHFEFYRKYTFFAQMQ